MVALPTALDRAFDAFFDILGKSLTLLAYVTEIIYSRLGHQFF